MKRWSNSCVTVLVCVIALLIGSTGVSANGPINLSQSATDVTSAEMVVDSSGQVHLVWCDDGSLWHSVGTDGSWGGSVLIATGWSPDVCADQNGGLHLVFVAHPDAAQDVLYAYYAAGQGWGLPTNVSQSPNASTAPSVAQSAEGHLAVIWSELSASESLIMRGSSDDGSSWATSPIPQATGTSPETVYASDGAQIVVWEDAFDVGFPLEIMASRLGPEPGATWSLPQDVSFSIHDASRTPACVASESAVWLAWEEVTLGGSAIMTANLVGDVWSEAVSVTAHGSHQYPALAADSENAIHLAWVDGTVIRRAMLADVSAHWAMSDPLETGAETVSGLSLAMASMPHVSWLSGTEGVDRDVWAYAWGATPVDGHALHLPMVFR